MFLTSSSGYYQPYIPWKGESTYSITSSWSKPLLKPEEDSDNPFLGLPFKARPIKLEKQLMPTANLVIQSKDLFLTIQVTVSI